MEVGDVLRERSTASAALGVLGGKEFLNVAGAKLAIQGAAATEADIDNCSARVAAPRLQ